MKNNNSNSKMSIYSFLPLLAAIMWGFGFVAQVSGIETIPPIFYNAVRFTLAGLVLIPLTLIVEKTYSQTVKDTIKYGFFAGLFLCTASSIQQFGLVLTSSAAKGGFLTSLYAIFVSLGEFMFFKRKIKFNTWLAVLISVLGLFLIFIGSDTSTLNLSITPGDIVLLLCAVAFAGHIIFIDKIIDKVRPILFASTQFLTVGVLSLIYSLIFEDPTISSLKSGYIPLLYGGLVSCAGGYTCQVLSQKSKTPILTGILFSTESMFALIGGALILHERLSFVALIGCALILLSVIISEVIR